MSAFVYVLRSPKGHFYVGQTSSLPGRLAAHRTDKAAKFVRDYKPFQLVYFEKYNTRTEAMRREQQLKGWRRAKKEALITGNLDRLKKL